MSESEDGAWRVRAARRYVWRTVLLWVVGLGLPVSLAVTIREPEYGGNLMFHVLLFGALLSWKVKKPKDFLPEGDE
ncbi:MAG: hypothetical protein OXR82_14690 [Gammaproteobacteria bacterium]|nr:hypothetical protein [Gammaproteobacteria bacterium]